jgi:glycosyltransferase involved in cell wall biosynthesis
MLKAMRLAVISSLLPADTHGGAEAYVGMVGRSLAERHDVVVLTGSRTLSDDGLPIVRLPRLPKLAPSAPLAGRVVWHALDQWLPQVHLAVARALRELKPDVVATHQPQGLSAAVFTAVASSGLPHVHTAHDLNLLCARVTMTRGGEFCGGRCAACRVQRVIRGTAAGVRLSRLIGVSRYICERHIRAGIVPRDRASAVRLGAEPGSARLRQLDGQVTLGFIGSIAPHKGVRTLLAAMRLTEAPWRLLLAGSGELEDEIRAAAERDPRIEYVGHVSGAAKDAFFDRLDLVVVPSEWEEPATFVVAEAAIRGIPAIVSGRGGLPETPEAQTFRAGDAQELLRAIHWFVDEPTRLREASARLLERRHEFDWSTHVRTVERLLEAAYDEGRSAP